MGKALLILAVLPAHDLYRTFVKGQSLIGDHKIYVKFHLISETGTLGACAERIIERETPGFDLTDGYPAIGTAEVL